MRALAPKQPGLRRVGVLGKPGRDRQRTIERLHRSIGNRAVQRAMNEGVRWDASSISSTSATPRLSVNESGDRCEREADPLRGHTSPASAFQREHKSLSERDRPSFVSDGLSRRRYRLQALPTAQASYRDAATLPSSVRSFLGNSGGHPLTPWIRNEAESKWGYDLGAVRIHCGAAAERSVASVSADAYTVGHDIVLGHEVGGSMQRSDRRVLLHEIVHTIQQDPGDKKASSTSVGTLAAERDADRAAYSGQLSFPKVSVPVRLLRQQSTNPLNPPMENVEMPWIGKGKGVTSSELGFERNQRKFWRAFHKKYGHLGMLSRANLKRILGNPFRAPRVDKPWIDYYPQHKAYKGDVLDHHHMGQGSGTVPLPRKLHKAHAVFHPERQRVDAGKKGTSRPGKPLKPRPTRAVTKQVVARAVEALRFPGYRPNKQPAVPVVAPSSPVAAKSSTERRPVSLSERTDVKRVDPQTGQVRTRGSTGVTVRSVGISLVTGYLRRRLSDAAIRARAQTEGYVGYGTLTYKNRDLPERLYRFIEDPTGAEHIPLNERFNVGVWRAKLRAAAGETLTGGTLRVTWQIPVESEHPLIPPTVENVTIVYRKMSTGWMSLTTEASGSDEWPPNDVVPFAPDLNRIIDPARSDSEILKFLGLDDM